MPYVIWDWGLYFTIISILVRYLLGGQDDMAIEQCHLKEHMLAQCRVSSLSLLQLQLYNAAPFVRFCNWSVGVAFSIYTMWG